MLECLYEFIEGFTLRTRFFYSILNPPSDDSYYVLWFIFGDVKYWQIHSTLRPLLQFIHKRHFSCYEYNSDILLNIAIEPFEEVVKNSLLPTLEGQHICVFDDE